MARSSINASHLSLTAIAYIIAGCSAVLTGIFGSTFGGESWVLSAICFLMFFCISLLSPLLFNALTKSVLQQNWGKIAVFCCSDCFLRNRRDHERRYGSSVPQGRLGAHGQPERQGEERTQ